MEKRRGLSRTQKICIIALWILLCVMLFTIPSDKSLGENIFIAVASGLIIIIGVSAGQNRFNKSNRNRRR
jgi:hypothetical protein